MSVMLVRHTLVLQAVAVIFFYVLQGVESKSLQLNREQSMGTAQDGSATPEEPDSVIAFRTVNRVPRYAIFPSDDQSLSPSAVRIMAMLRNTVPRLSPYSKKRTCLINAGMSSGCDFKDYIQSHNARKIYESRMGPGKRSSPRSQEAEMIGFDGGELDYQQQAPRLLKRMECLSGLPGGDCENSFLGSESEGQDFLRPGGRNPGRR